MEYRYEYRDAVDNRERYVYPKKECECDCLGVDKLEYNGELLDVHLDNKEELKPNRIEPVEDFVYLECMGRYRIHYYMKRGKRSYFRGHNVKVIVTVEE
jgi:hypothetical protein